MRRRELLLAAAALAAGPLCALAQAPKVRRIGLLLPGTPETHKRMIDAFARRLGALGWEQGTNTALDIRYGDNRLERLAPLARELVETKPDLIITGSTPGALALKKATTTIPVVFTAVADPVALGLVQSLGRPGGNLTGVSSLILVTTEKRFELLKELVPKLERVAVLVTPGHPANKLLASQLEAAAKTGGATLVVVEARTAQGLEAAFAKAAAARVTAMVVPPDPFYYAQSKRIAQLATARRIATASSSDVFVRNGGLVSYGLDYVAEFASAAVYVDKILKGATPAQLPVEQRDRFVTTINRSTAKALGLTIPQTVLVRADEVIE